MDLPPFSEANLLDLAIYEAIQLPEVTLQESPARNSSPSQSRSPCLHISEANLLGLCTFEAIPPGLRTFEAILLGLCTPRYTHTEVTLQGHSGQEP